MIIIAAKPKSGPYISGKINKENTLGKVSNLYSALLRPLPKLPIINTEGKIPKKVPKK